MSNTIVSERLQVDAIHMFGEVIASPETISVIP